MKRPYGYHWVRCLGLAGNDVPLQAIWAAITLSRQLIFWVRLRRERLSEATLEQWQGAESDALRTFIAVHRYALLLQMAQAGRGQLR